VVKQFTVKIQQTPGRDRQERQTFLYSCRFQHILRKKYRQAFVIVLEERR
jgi:hypothetical protein